MEQNLFVFDRTSRDLFNMISQALLTTCRKVIHFNGEVPKNVERLNITNKQDARKQAEHIAQQLIAPFYFPEKQSEREHYADIYGIGLSKIIHNNEPYFVVAMCASTGETIYIEGTNNDGLEDKLKVRFESFIETNGVAA